MRPEVSDLWSPDGTSPEKGLYTMIDAVAVLGDSSDLAEEIFQSTLFTNLLNPGVIAAASGLVQFSVSPPFRCSFLHMRFQLAKGAGGALGQSASISYGRTEGLLFRRFSALFTFLLGSATTCHFSWADVALGACQNLLMFDDVFQGAASGIPFGLYQLEHALKFARPDEVHWTLAENQGQFLAKPGGSLLTDACCSSPPDPRTLVWFRLYVLPDNPLYFGNLLGHVLCIVKLLFESLTHLLLQSMLVRIRVWIHTFL
jgi:hypothetical protein